MNSKHQSLWIACLMFGIIAAPAMGEDNRMSLEKEAPLEYRDALLTQELQRSIRSQIEQVFAVFEAKDAKPSYSGELMAHALISAIEVSDGLLRLRRDKLPPWVAHESFSAALDKLNRHIEQTIGHISSVDEYELAMQSFSDADMSDVTLIPEHILHNMILESHGFDLTGIDASVAQPTRIEENNGVHTAVFEDVQIAIEVLPDETDEGENQ